MAFAMGLITSIVLTSLLIAGVLFSQIKIIEKDQKYLGYSGQEKTDEQVLGNSNSQNPDSDNLEIEKNETNLDGKDNNQALNTSLDQFIFPGSAIIESSEKKLILISKSEIEVISNWYDDLIEKNNYNVKSSVKTKVNSNRSTNIRASDGGSSVSIVIQQQANSLENKIEINYH
jgi:hypothetical protein